MKWKRLPTEDATWEATTLLHNQFPSPNLENKDPLGRGSIDRTKRSERISKKNPNFLA